MSGGSIPKWVLETAGRLLDAHFPKHKLMVDCKSHPEKTPKVNTAKGDWVAVNTIVTCQNIRWAINKFEASNKSSWEPTPAFYSREVIF